MPGSAASDGVVTTDILAGADNVASGVALQADGRIVVSGYTENGGDLDIGVVRYNTDGSLDTSFDGDGRVITDLTGSPDRADGIAVQADGRIVVGGSSVVGTTTDIALVCYAADGGLDPYHRCRRGTGVHGGRQPGTSDIGRFCQFTR